MIEVVARYSAVPLTAEDLEIYSRNITRQRRLIARSCDDFRPSAYYMRRGDKADAEIMFAKVDARNDANITRKKARKAKI